MLSCGPIASARVPETLADAVREGADQHLVGIEPLSRCGIRRPINAERVKGSWSAASNKDVPEMERLVLERIESDGLHRLGGRGRIKQQQQHAGRSLREEGEVHAVRMGGDPERMCGTRCSVERVHCFVTLSATQSWSLTLAVSRNAACSPVTFRFMSTAIRHRRPGASPRNGRWSGGWLRGRPRSPRVAKPHRARSFMAVWFRSAQVTISQAEPYRVVSHHCRNRVRLRQLDNCGVNFMARFLDQSVRLLR